MYETAVMWQQWLPRPEGFVPCPAPTPRRLVNNPGFRNGPPVVKSPE